MQADAGGNLLEHAVNQPRQFGPHFVHAKAVRVRFTPQLMS